MYARPRDAATSRATPRILKAYPRSGLTAISKITSFISSALMASAPIATDPSAKVMIPA